MDKQEIVTLPNGESGKNVKDATSIPDSWSVKNGPAGHADREELLSFGDKYKKIGPWSGYARGE